MPCLNMVFSVVFRVTVFFLIFCVPMLSAIGGPSDYEIPDAFPALSTKKHHKVNGSDFVIVST